MRDPDVKRVGALPSATGGIARLAYAHAKEAGIALEPLLKKAGLTLHQIEDPSIRLKVRNQISFLNLAAGALQDHLLGFHLAQSFELREIGLLYYVLASSEMLGEALQRAVRYSSIVNEGISLKYVGGRDVGITFDYLGISRHLGSASNRVLDDDPGSCVPEINGSSSDANPRETYPSPRRRAF